MEKFRAFLKRKNIVFSARRYGIDALGAMAQGLFCSLLIGTIIKTLGTQLNLSYLSDIGSYAMAVSGPAMAVAIGYALQAPPWGTCILWWKKPLTVLARTPSCVPWTRKAACWKFPGSSAAARIRKQASLTPGICWAWIDALRQTEIFIEKGSPGANLPENPFRLSISFFP